MREGILRLNESHRDQLSNDLGSIAGLLFDLGSGLYTAPPLADDAGAFAAWERDLAKVLASAPGAEAVRLIDVLWLEHDKPQVVAAFEVEHTTSIYSGIIRLVDLALGAPGQATRGLFLVAPDDREEQIRAQLRRPAFRSIISLEVRYLPYSELEQHRGAMARFGAGLKAIEAVARTLV